MSDAKLAEDLIKGNPRAYNIVEKIILVYKNRESLIIFNNFNINGEKLVLMWEDFCQEDNIKLQIVALLLEGGYLNNKYVQKNFDPDLMVQLVDFEKDSARELITLDKRKKPWKRKAKEIRKKFEKRLKEKGAI